MSSCLRSGEHFNNFPAIPDRSILPPPASMLSKQEFKTSLILQGGSISAPPPDPSQNISAQAQASANDPKLDSSPSNIPGTPQEQQQVKDAPASGIGRKRSTVAFQALPEASIRSTIYPPISGIASRLSLMTTPASSRKPSLSPAPSPTPPQTDKLNTQRGSAIYPSGVAPRASFATTLPDPLAVSSQKPSLSPAPSSDPPQPHASNSPRASVIHPSIAAPRFSLVTMSSPSPDVSSRKLSLGPPPPAPAIAAAAIDQAVAPQPATAENPSEFLQRRRSAAALQRQKSSGDPNSPASQAIVQRRSQVLNTVQRARSRLSQLSHETVRRKRDFGKSWFGRFQKWVFQREQKRLRGKGPKLLRLWEGSLKSMENSYGSSMMLAFAFIRWVFLLNSVLAVLWTVVMIIPFMAFPPSTFSWKIFLHDLTDKQGLKNIAQGESLEKTFVYYGGYTYTRSEEKGWYRVDYMYAVLIGATFLISFLGALGRIAGRIMNSGDIAMAARLYPFSALVFASWDFHITSLEAAAKLRRGVRMQLKEMLADTKLKTKYTGIIEHLMSAKRFIALFILWPLVMGGTVVVVVELVTKADKINDKLGSQYAQALLFTVLNNVTPVVVRLLVEMEDFKPATAERVLLAKLFCLRTLNLATLFYRLFMMLSHTLAVRSGEVAVEACEDKATCSEGFTCCTRVNMTEWNICTEQDINFCLPACTENLVGAQLLRLIVITTIARTIFEFGWGFGYVWAFSGNKRQLLIEDMAIDVVYVQALVWVGVCFSPMASVLGFFSNLFTWYTMRFALFKTCAPVEKAFSASRTSSLTYGLLLFTLILSTIPATISVMQKSSGFCGPIHEQASMYTIVGRYIQKAPSAIWITLSWLTNPAVLLGVIFFLIFIVVLVQSQLVQSQQFLALTKYEMGTQRKESYEKLKRVRQSLSQSSPANRNAPKLDPSSPWSESEEASEFYVIPKPTLPSPTQSVKPSAINPYESIFEDGS